MKKLFFPLKLSIAASLILHTVIVFILATIVAALSGKFALIVLIAIATAAITIFTIGNIFQYVEEEYTKRTKEFESVSSNLKETSSLLRVQKKELEHCVVYLSQYSEAMGKIAAGINTADQAPSEQITLQSINDVESPILHNRVVPRGDGHDKA